jgi:hypothetical protein
MSLSPTVLIQQPVPLSTSVRFLSGSRPQAPS